MVIAFSQGPVVNGQPPSYFLQSHQTAPKDNERVVVVEGFDFKDIDSVFQKLQELTKRWFEDNDMIFHIVGTETCKSMQVRPPRGKEYKMGTLPSFIKMQWQGIQPAKTG